MLRCKDNKRGHLLHRCAKNKMQKYDEGANVLKELTENVSL